MGIAVGSTVSICQPTHSLAGDVSLSDDLSLSSALSVQYGGNETVDGNGHTIYGNNNSGFFVYSGSLTINETTLTGFTTTGGSGSGGGAGLGGALFVNDGASVTLNDVSFGGNAAIGGAGGVSSTGGSLNNLFNSGVAGATGADGSDAAAGAAYVNGGNGGNGYNGADGESGVTGVGGAGGNGGSGSDGSAITADTVKTALDVTYDGLTAAEDGTVSGVYTSIAASFAAQAAAATAGVTTAGLAAGFTALAAQYTTLAAETAGATLTKDLAKAIFDGAYLTAITVTNLEVGAAGNGGEGGKGGTGGAGSFGSGGGIGGAGGSGGDAYSASKAVGGAGGDGGDGGEGGFGAGGGLGGNGGSAGSDGSSAVNAAADGDGGAGGNGGFGAGSGSTADGSANGVSGNGGSGYGGSIFVNSGGALNINGTSTFSQGHVFGGGSKNGGDSGEGAGTDLFMMKGSTVNLNAGSGIITFNGTIADDSKASIGASDIPDGQGASINVNSGLVIFNGNNTYSGRTNLNGGVLQAWDGEGLYTNSNLNFNGGVFQTNGTFDRYTGTAAYQVQWTGSGGFAAVGDPLFVQLNGGGTLTWGSNSFVPNGSSLIFGSSSATDDVTFSNKINLAGGNRSILVAANDDNTDLAILTGVLSNGALTVGDATHDGILALTAANTYAGGTTITNGTLALKNSAGLNTNGAMTIGSPGVFDISQTGDQAIGDLSGDGIANLGDNRLTINQAGNTTFSGSINDGGIGGGLGASVTKAGAGALTLSGANRYTGATEITGGTLTLTGSLDSQNVHVAAGTILNDVDGGLHATSALSNDGTINLSADDAVSTFASTGTLNGSPYTLTAATYALNSGSVINANLGSGAVTANGTVQLNGASSAETFHVQTGTTTLGAVERLLNATDLTVDALATLALGGAEKIGSLFGAGIVDINAGAFTVDDGNFSGVIAGTNPAYGLTKVSSGALTLSGANTYAGPTDVTAGTLNLTGSLLGNVVNIANGATLNDVTSGLANGAILTDNGTVNLSVDETIDQLFGTGVLTLGGRLTVSSGDFSGVISTNNPSHDLFKVSSGVLTLAGANTYVGTTEIAGGTLTLTGNLNSQNVHIAAGTTLNDVNGGLHATSALSNDGTVNLGADDVVSTFASTGTLNGSPYTLTAATYALNNGSVIDANLGTGVVTANGVVQLNGASSAEIVNIATGTTTLGSAERLLDSANVTISSSGTLVLGGDETIGTLLGSGLINANSYQLILTEGGAFSGTIDNAADLIANGSEVNINGGTVNSESFGVTNGGVINLNGSTVNAGEVNIINGILNVNTGSALYSSENIFVASGATVVVAGTGAVTGVVITIDGKLDVLDGNSLNYDLLNGSGTVGHAGYVFINNLNETIGGNLTFLGDLTNSGILSPGNSPGVTTITGNYTESGTLQIELQTTTPITGHDQVEVGGTTMLTSGSALVVDAYNGILPSRGNEYQIVSDLDGNAVRVNGTFETVAFDEDGVSGPGAATANAAVVFDVATGRLTATGLNASDSVFADLGGNSNQRAAASALFNAAQVASNQIDTETLVGTLAHQIIDSQGTPSGDLAHYTPTFYGAMADYTFTGDRALSRLARKDRLVSTGKINDRANIFVGTLLNDATSGDDSDVSRYDYYLGGEYAVSPTFSLGALISKNDGDIDSALGSDDITGSTGQLYVRTALSEAFELSGSFSYSQTDNDLQRSTMQGRVKGTSDTSAYTGAIGVAYKNGATFAGAVVTPSLDVYYSSATMDGFSEHGAVDSLKNFGTTADELVARIGASAVWNTSISGKSFSFEVNPAVEQTVSGDSGNINLQMNSIPEVNYGIDYIDKNKTTEVVGVNVGYAIFDKSTISIGYEGRLNDQFDSQLNAKFKMSF